ncbi:nickel-dependent lactate racemase [Desulfohalotomaculum tongense]|uniref:nickel-dependent lactate racemase n=1 Tax=Desulforadius tongensis TaxID=1216062 RepID=UPI00195C9D2D|nr:nickel-dependent lactate racemase [Desulforadius tongensis]MBM7855918.1 nickel-dependent lactate racemase [Desulforadius tongensis]
MKLKLPYGRSYLQVDIDPGNVAGVLMPRGMRTAGAEETVREALAAPIGSDSLYRLALQKKPRHTAIIISDVTRPVPYGVMLPPLLEELRQAGIKPEQITIVIGTGCHRPNTKQETIQALGQDIVSRYKIINHHCDGNLVLMGTLNDGTRLWVNSTVAGADLKLALGLIIPHKLAGYSGGSKAILPGVCGRETITANHSMMNDPQAKEGNWKDNPVRIQMDEAAKRVGLDFILNVVTNHKNEIVSAVAGDVKLAWLKGVEACRWLCSVTVPYQCPVTIASCGGYPRDINVYQAVKPMVNASQLTEKGGTIVICARCQEGYGDRIFARWIRDARTPGDIIDRFNEQYVLGGHKGYVLAELVRNYEVVLVSDLCREDSGRLFVTHQPDLAGAVNYIKEKHGPGYRAWVLPYAGLILPAMDVKKGSNCR